MRNNLRQNFEERQKMYLPYLCRSCYYDVDGIAAISSAHSPTFPSLHLRHSSFSNPFVALPTSPLILKLFRSFTYVTTHSPTLILLLLRHRLITYVTRRASHAYLLC